MSPKPQLFLYTWVFLWLMVFRALWHTSSDASAAQHGSLWHPTLITSISDANLLFEFLLTGLVIDEDDNVVILDQELASMRQGRDFLTLINDHIPKTVPEMEQLLVTLERKEQPFSQDQFETLILGIIYSAYKVQKHVHENQQQSWAGVLGRLANVTLNQLRRP